MLRKLQQLRDRHEQVGHEQAERREQGRPLPRRPGEGPGPSPRARAGIGANEAGASRSRVPKSGEFYLT